MSTTGDPVRQHYERASEGGDLLAQVTQALSQLGESITSAQLAGFDQFHTRGLAATVELGELLGLQRHSEVLDAGSGLGGPSRFLAETCGCRVTGVDLVPGYVEIATLLAQRCGLGDSVRYEVGDLAQLPFADHHFDAVITQHVVMNIRDRAQVYREIHRVLKPAGPFAFYDVLRADDAAEPTYPVPWAQTEATSVLLTEAQTRAALQQAGLIPEVWIDVTAKAVAWFAQPRPPSTAGLSLATVMGPGFGQMSANLARNLAEGRLRLVMARCLST